MMSIDALRVLIAPSGFKESLDAEEAADCIALGVMRASSAVCIAKVPMVDGGEGFTKTLVRMTNGKLHETRVIGPVGQPVESHFGFMGGRKNKIAVIEMAAAAGLRLVPRDQRDPLHTTTYGVGELIKAALDGGAESILLGCGDSGTNDGGAGMIQALGGKLLDANGKQIGMGGAELARLAKIDLSELDPRIRRVKIDVACNWHNVLCGSKGVAQVFGPQKGASSQDVQQLAAALENFAAIIHRDLNTDIRYLPGSGASGGLGGGAFACLGACLHPRYDIIMRYIDLDSRLTWADLVITAEGALDFQTPFGKVPTEVARRARIYGVPVIALAGTLGRGVDDVYAAGIDAFSSIMPAPETLEHAITNAATYLANAAERVMRQVNVGLRLGQKVG
jgi:glycerate 2-kinase